MARPRAFDKDKALDAALGVFWRQGYANTSIQDLESGMGIGRTSIYAAFGNKENLFLSVLDRYNEIYTQSSRDTLAPQPDIRAALNQYFLDFVASFTDPTLPLGCLFTNTAAETKDLATPIGRKVSRSLGQTEGVLYRLLCYGQSNDEIDRSIDPRAFSRYFVAVMKGLSVLAKSSVDPSVLQDAVDALLFSIDRTFGWDARDDERGALGVTPAARDDRVDAAERVWARRHRSKPSRGGRS